MTDELEKIALVVEFHLEVKPHNSLDEECVFGKGKKWPGLGCSASLPEIVEPSILDHDLGGP